MFTLFPVPVGLRCVSRVSSKQLGKPTDYEDFGKGMKRDILIQILSIWHGRKMAYGYI